MKERSAAEKYVIDMRRLAGHPRPAHAGPTEARFCFEYGATKHGGGDVFADVWKRDFFGKEYKGQHKDRCRHHVRCLRVAGGHGRRADS